MLVEYVFRGIKYNEPYKINRSTCLPDFALIPKHEESNYTAQKTQSQVIEENLIPKDMEFPPLLRSLLIQNGNKNPRLPVALNDRENHKTMYRVAKEGENPTKKFETGFGTAKVPHFVETVDYNV